MKTIIKETKKPKVVPIFTDEMHKQIFVFQDGLPQKFTSRGGKIIDPISTRKGNVRGSRISVR